MKTRLKKNISWHLLLLILISLVIIIQYLAKTHLIELQNFYIPDSYTYEIKALIEQDFNELPKALYYRFNYLLYNIAPQSFLIFNSSLLFMSLNICRDVFQYISPQAISYSRLAIVGNPYLLIGVIGPNKETILIFIYLLFWRSLFLLTGIQRIIALIIIGSVPITIRPVLSFCLFISVVTYLVIYRFNKPRVLIIFFVVLFFLFNSTPFGNNFITGLQDDDLTSFRSSNVYDIALLLKNFSQDALLQYPAFIAKTIIILFAPIVRPFNIFQIPLPLLDIGYTIVAYLYLPFNASLVILFFNRTKLLYLEKKKKISILLFCTIISVLVVILNPLLSFRYIFPYSPFIFSLFAIHSSTTKKKLVNISIFVTIILVLFSPMYSSDSVSLSTYENIPEFLNWL
ncbi:hypothetical protein [Scytonema sp. PCC 10023]|uniref:hypothetical protein n=1 Tax=Scytonema sp. PCC 10023 TaxID=1680591 RepID=UPI0039C66CBD